MEMTNKNTYVVVFMGAKRLYEQACSALSESSEFGDYVKHAKAMKDLCYAQALYYEGYMTKEQLDNIAIHGTGIAYSCLARFAVVD